MVKLPYISDDDGVILYSLPNCPNCMILKDALNLAKVRYKTLMMDSAEGITDLRSCGCFAMQAPVLQVNDTFYEDLF